MRIEREMFRAVTRHARASGAYFAREFLENLNDDNTFAIGGCFEGRFGGCPRNEDGIGNRGKSDPLPRISIYSPIRRHERRGAAW